MLTMPRCRGRLSRRAPLAAPLPLEPLPAGEPPLDASAAAPCVLLPLLLPPFAAWPSASCAAPASASSSAFTAAAVPFGRPGRVDEIAAGIVWLASDESSYVTGAELVIDGGRSIA